MEAVGVVVVAAGKGLRMGTTVSKQYIELGGKPILIHTLEALERVEKIGEIVLVVGKADIDRCKVWMKEYGIQKCTQIVAGGEDRQASVFAGLQALSAEVTWVMVHDGVQPFVTEEQLERLWEKAKAHEAAVLAVPVKDTIKVVHEDGWIESTPERSKLWAIQTPQAFRLTTLKEAYLAAERDGFRGTDDAMLVERLGVKVHVVAGEYTNIKITTPEDLQLGEWLVEERLRDD